MHKNLERGWHPYPKGATRLRYFDGRRWTNNYRDSHPSGDQAAAAASAAPARRVSAAGVTPTAHWKKAVIKNYGNIEGRACGAECAWTLLTNAGIVLLLFLPVVVGGEAWVFLPVMGLIALVSPSLAVTVRRLHDTGKSGKYVFLTCIPIVGPFLLLGLMVAESEIGGNQYGRAPSQA